MKYHTDRNLETSPGV